MLLILDVQRDITILESFMAEVCVSLCAVWVSVCRVNGLLLYVCDYSYTLFSVWKFRQHQRTSVRNQQICAVIDRHIPNNTLKTMHWCLTIYGIRGVLSFGW